MASADPCVDVTEKRQFSYDELVQAHLAGAVECVVELYNKSQRLTQVNVFSYLKPGVKIPFKIDKKLNIYSRLTVTEAHERFPTQLFDDPPIIGRQAIIRREKVEYGYCEVRGCDDQCPQVANVTQYLYLNKWVGVVRLSGCVKLYLMPSSTLTDHLGMTYPDHPRVLHGMFVRKLRRSKHLANILSGGDIDSAELEPRSKKRKIVSFAEDNTSSQDISKEKVLLSAFTATPVLKLTREKVKIQIKTPADAIMTHSVETPEPGEVIELCEGLIEEEEAPELLLETAERPIKSRVSLAEYKRRRSTTDDRGVVNRKEDGAETDKEKTPPFQIPLTISSEKYNLTTDDRGVVTESENNTETKKEKLIERSPTTDGGGVVTKRKSSIETHKEQDPPLKVTPYFPTTDDGEVFTVRENLTETDKDKISPIETPLTLDTYHLTTDGQGVVNKRASDKISPSEVTVPLTRCSTTDDEAETKAPLNEVPLTSEVMTTIVLPDSRLITDVSISMTNSSVTVSDSIFTVSDSITVSDCTPLSTHSSLSEPGFKTPTTAVSAASNTSLTISTQSSPVLDSESPLMKPSAQSHSFQELITDVKFDDNSKPPSLANSLDKSPVTTVCSNSITPPLHTLTPATPAVPIVPSMADPPPPATPIIPPQYFYQNPWLMESRMIGTPRNFFRPPQMDVPRPSALPVPFPAAAPPSLGRYFPSDMFSTFNRYPVDDMLRLPRRSKRRSRSRSSSRSRSRSRSRSTSRSRSNHSDTNTVEASKQFMSKVISNLMKTHSESNEEKMDATTQTTVKTTSRRLQAGQGFKLMSVRSQTAHHTHSQSVQCKIEPKVMNKRVQTDSLPMSDNYTQTYIRMKDNSSQTKRSGNSRETIVEYNKTLGETIGVCDDSDVAEICRDSLTELLLELGFNSDDGSDYDTASMSVSSIDSDIERQPSPMFSGASNISEGELFDDSLVNELYSPSHPLDDPVSPGNSVTVMTAGPSLDAEPSQPSTDNDIDTAPSRVLIPFLEHLQPHIPHSVIPGLDTGNDTAPSRVPFPFMEHFHQPPITHSVIPGLDTEPSQSSTDISSTSFLEHLHQSSIPHSVIPGLDTEPSQSSTDISSTSFLEHLHHPSIPHSVIPGLDAEPSTDISSPSFLEHPHQSSIPYSVIPGLDAEPSQSSTDISSSFLEHPHQSSITHSVIPGLDAKPSQSSTDISSSFLEHPHQSSIPHSVIPGLDADPSQSARPSTDNDTFPSRVPIPFLEHLHQPPIPHSPFPAPPPLPPSHPPSESEPEELPEKGSRSSRSSSSSSNSSATSNNSTPRSSPEPPESGGMTQAGGSSHLRSPYGSKSPHNSNVKQSPQKQSPADHEPNETECVDCVFIEAENKHREDFVSQTSLNCNQSKLKGETPRTVSPIPNFVWLRSPRANSIPVKSREDSESPPKSSVNTSDKESSPLYDAAISIQLRSSAELNFENPPITTPKKPSLTAAQLLAIARAKRSSPEDRRTKDPFDTKPSATFHRQERTNSEHAGSRSGIDMQQLMANFHQHMYKRSSMGSLFSRIQSYPPTQRPNPEFSTSLNRSMPSILQQVTPNQQQITPYRKIENFPGSSSREQTLSSHDKQPQPDQTRAKSTDSFDLRPKPCDQSTVFTPRNLASDFYGPALPMDMCDHPKTSDSSSPEELPGRNATSDFCGPALPMDTIYKTSNSSSPEVLRGGQDRAPFTVINTPVNSPMLPSPLHCPSLHSAVNSGCDRTLNIPFPAKTTTFVENADSEDTISIDERADTCLDKDFDGTVSAQSIAMDDLAHTSNSNDNPLSKQNISPEDDGEEPLSKNVQHMEIVKCTFAESTAVEDCPIVSVQTDTHTTTPAKTTTVVHAGSEHNKSIDKHLAICVKEENSEGTVSAQSMDVLAHTRDSNDNPSSKQIISPEDDIQQAEEQPSVKAQEIAKIIEDSSAVEDNLILSAHGESIPNPSTDSVEAGRNKAVSEILSPMEELRAQQEHPLEVAKESSSTTQKHQIPSAMVTNNVQYESYDSLAAECMSFARTIESTPATTEKPLNELETSMKNFEIAKEANLVPVAPIQHLAPTVALPEGVSTQEADMQKPITVCGTGTVQLSIEPLFNNTTEQEIPIEANKDIITRHKQLSICSEIADCEGTVSAQSVDDLAHTRDSNDNPLSKQNISPQSDREEQPSIKAQHMEIATVEYSAAVEDGLILSAHGESIPNPSTDSVEAGRNKTVSEILSPMEELRALQEHPLEVAKESSSTDILTQKHQIPSAMEPNNVQYESYDTLAAESMFFAQTVESTPARTEKPLNEFETSMKNFEIAKEANPVPVAPIQHLTPTVVLSEGESTQEADMQKPITVCGTGTVQLTIEPLFNNTTEQEIPIEANKDIITRHKQLSICFEGADSEGIVSAQSVDDLAHTRDSNDNPLSKQNISPQSDRQEQSSIKAQHMEIATVEDSAAAEDGLILSAHGESIPNPSTDSVEAVRNKTVSDILSPMEELRAQQEHPLEVAKESSSTEILAEIVQKHQIPSAMVTNEVQYESYDTLATESMSSERTIESTPAITEKPLNELETSIKNFEIAKEVNPVPVAPIQHLTPTVALPEGVSTHEADMQKPITVCGTETVQLTLFKNTTEQEMPPEGDKDSAILITRHKQLAICFEGADSEGTVSAQSVDDLAHTRDSNDNPLSKQNISPQEEQPSMKTQHMEIATLEDSTAVEDSAAVEDNLILTAHGESIPNPSTDSVEAGRNKAVSEILSPIEELRALKEQYPLEVATLKISSTEIEIVHKHQIPSAIAFTNEVQCVSCNSLVTERGESTSFAQTNQQEMNVESTPAIAEKPFYEFETSMKRLPVEIEIAKKANPVPVAPIQHLAPTVVLPEGGSTDMEKPITTVCGTGTLQRTIEPLFKNTTEQEMPIQANKDSAYLITKQPSMNAQHMEIVKCTLEESTIVTVEDCPRDTNTTTYVEHAGSEDIKPTDKQLAICFEEEISEVTVSAQSMDDLAHTRDSNDNPLSKQNISPQDDREEQPSIKEQHMEIATLEDSAAAEDKLILTSYGESIPNPSTDSVEAGRNKAVSDILSPMEELRAQQEHPLEVGKESSSTESLAEIVQKHQIPSAMVTNEVQYESYDTLATESMSSERTIESTPAITEKPLNELETSMKNFEIAKEVNPVPVAPIQHLAPTVALPEGGSTQEADMQKPITVCGTGTVQLTIEPLFKNTTEQEMPLESDKDSAILIEANIVSPIQVQSISSPCEEAPIKLTISSQVLSEQNSIKADGVQMMCDAKTIELSDTRKQLVMEEAVAVEPVSIKLECATERISEAEIQQELNYFPPLLPTTCTCTAAAAEEEIKFEYPEDSTNVFSAGQVVTEQQLATSGETDQEAIEQVSEINTALLNMIPASPIGPLTKEPEQPHEEYMNEYSISFSDKDFELCRHSNKDHIMEVTVDPPNDIHVPKDSNILLTSEHVESKITRRSSGRQRTISTKYKDSWLFTKDSSSKDCSITSPQQKHVYTSTVEDLLPLVTRSPLITKLKPETTHSQCDPTVESQCVYTDVMCTADTLKSMQGSCHSQPSPESQVVIPIHNKPSHLTIDTPMQSKPNDVPMSPSPLRSTHHKQCAQTYPLLTQTTPTSPHFSRTTIVQQKPKLHKTTVKQKAPLSVNISLSHLRRLLSTVHKPSPTTETKREITHRPDSRIKSQCGDTDFTCTSERSKRRNDPASTPVQVKSNEKPLLTAQSKCNTVPSQPTADIRVQSKHSEPAPTYPLSAHPPLFSPTSLLSAHPPPLFSPTSPLSAHPPLSSPTYPQSAHPPLFPPTYPQSAHPPLSSPTYSLSAHPPLSSPTYPLSAHPPLSSPTSPLSAHPPLSSPTYPLSVHPPLSFPTFPFSVHNSYLTGTLVKNAESNQLCLVIAGRNPLDNHIEPVRPVAIKNKVVSNSSELQTINVPVNTPNSDSTIGTKRSVEVNLTLPMQQSNTEVEYETEKSSSEIVATISANEGDGSVENVSIVNHDSTDKMSVTSQMSVTESNVEKSTSVNHGVIMVQVNTSTKVESSTRELCNLEVHVPMNTADADYGPNSRIKDTPSPAVHEQTSNANERANTRRELYAPTRPLLVSRPRYHPYCHRHPSSSHRATYPAQMKPRESTITLLGPSSFPNNLANDSNSWNYWPD